MALSPSSTRRQDLGAPNSPAANSPPPTSQPMYLVPLSPPLSTSSPTLGHNDNEQDQKDVNPMTMSSIKKLEEETMQLRKRLAELELAMANLKKGGSSNGAKVNVARETKEKIDLLLAKLEKAGVEIDGKVASIIGDGIARIKAEARENINEPKRAEMSTLLIFASVVAGFILGVEWQENIFRKEFARMKRA